MQEEICSKCGKHLTASDKVIHDEGHTFCSNLCCVTFDYQVAYEQLWLHIAEDAAT